MCPGCFPHERRRLPLFLDLPETDRCACQSLNRSNSLFGSSESHPESNSDAGLVKDCHSRVGGERRPRQGAPRVPRRGERARRREDDVDLGVGELRRDEMRFLTAMAVFGGGSGVSPRLVKDTP